MVSFGILSPYTDPRMATICFFLLGTYDCVKQLTKLKRGSFQGYYNRLRVAALISVFIHVVTGFAFTIMFLNGDYSIGASVVLAISCVFTNVCLFQLFCLWFMGQLSSLH